MTNNTVKLLCEQLEESNDCMLALADTLRKYGHNTTDLREQVRRNERIVEFCKINGLHVVLPQKQTHIFKRKLPDGTIDHYDEDLYNAGEIEAVLRHIGVGFIRL